MGRGGRPDHPKAEEEVKPSVTTEMRWFLEELSPKTGEWSSVYFGYKFTYEQALEKLRLHRKNNTRFNAKNRYVYRLVCQITQRFP
jgi:hypothetical protein